MDIHDLKIFLMIAQESSVSKASKILYMTPQGTSKVLKNLETEMGCQLFIRDKSGMQLTESGERFREYALKDVDDYYQVKKDILHIEQRQKKVVDLLSAYGILRLLTPDCLVAFRESIRISNSITGNIRICQSNSFLPEMKGMWHFLLESSMSIYIM